MPSIRAYNQMGPFWDWVASFEDQAASHPWAAGNNPRGNGNNDNNDNTANPNPFDNWGGPWGWGSQLPHRGRNGPWGRPRGPHHGPPPPAPPPADSSSMPQPPPPAFEATPLSSDDEIETVHMEDNDGEDGPRVTIESDGDGEGVDNGFGPDRRRGGMRGRGGARGRGGRGGFGLGRGHGRPHHHGHHGHGRHGAGNGMNNDAEDNEQHTGEASTGHRSGPRFDGRCGPGASRPPFPFPFQTAAIGNSLGDFLQTQIFGNQESKDKENGVFRPVVDVFDGPEAYVVHVSLSGAKKEDVGVHWEADKSELTIAGVIYRPADEEMLKTIAMSERKVGEFKRKVRLGGRSRPAPVDVESISAKMEDGVLRIEVPKLDTGYVDIKRVDIE